MLIYLCGVLVFLPVPIYLCGVCIYVSVQMYIYITEKSGSILLCNVTFPTQAFSTSCAHIYQPNYFSLEQLHSSTQYRNSIVWKLGQKNHALVDWTLRFSLFSAIISYAKYMCVLYYSSCILVRCCDVNCPDVELQKERQYVLVCVTVSETALRACWAACTMEPAHGLHSASGSWLGRDPSFVEEARDLAATQLENIQQHLRQPLWCPSSLTFEKQSQPMKLPAEEKKKNLISIAKSSSKKLAPRLLCLRASLSTSFILVVCLPTLSSSANLIRPWGENTLTRQNCNNWGE